MKSSQNDYYPSLDHISALAAFTVFVWHFNHINDLHLGTPIPLFSFLAEGHIGVAIFMSLSGYIFAKLLDDKKILYLPFLWNRAIRLFPLLFLVLSLLVFRIVYSGGDLGAYLIDLRNGFILPTWPNGGWSITVEMHFYIILPLLLLISYKNPSYLLGIVGAALLLRSMIWANTGSVQMPAYWTIFGGIDQFVLGMFAFKSRRLVAGKHARAIVLGVAVLAYVAYFDRLGGFYSNIAYPSPHPIWIVHPTMLGIAFAYLIAWYDLSFMEMKSRFSRGVAMIGACSYSIYLLHFFVVSNMADWINANVIRLDTFPLALAAAAVSFVAFVPVAYASYRIIELPPLRYRRNYRVD